MSKSLYIVRHAKACWPEHHQRDFDRELDHSGREEAKIMGRWLADTYPCPEHWISSPAPRALGTARLFADAHEQRIPIHEEDSIYEAPWQNLLKVLNSAPADANSIILFGHNPGVSYLTSALSNHGVDFSTASIACLSLKVEQWNQLAPNTCDLVQIVKP